MAVGAIFRACFLQNLHGQKLVTVTHWRESATGSGDSQVQLAGKLDNVYGTQIRPYLSHEWDYEMVAVQQISPGILRRSTFVGSNAGVGGDAQDSIPVPACATITLRTALAGRKYRGRVFQAGIPIDDVTDSQIEATPRAAYNTQYATLFSTQSASAYTWEPVLWHRSSASYTDINEVLMRVPLRVQRRREVGRGQ